MKLTLFLSCLIPSSQTALVMGLRFIGQLCFVFPFKNICLIKELSLKKKKNSSAVVQNKEKYIFWSYHNRICIWKCELSRWLPVDFKARWASSWQQVDLAGCYLPCFPWCPVVRVCCMLFSYTGVAQSQDDGPLHKGSYSSVCEE